MADHLHSTAAVDLINSGALDDFCIDAYAFVWNSDESGYDLALEVSASNASLESHSFLFQGVCEAHVPRFGTGRSQIGIPRVEALKDGWDGLRFELFDVDGAGVALKFRRLMTVSGDVGRTQMDR